jgi:hypothetical protein
VIDDVNEESPYAGRPAEICHRSDPRDLALAER